MTDILTTAVPARRVGVPVFFRDPRARLLSVAAVALILGFWLLTRYPALLHKSETLGRGVASMTFATEVWAVAGDAALSTRILSGAVNWLWAMKIGMTFGVLFGALLHTTLRYFPLRVGGNVMLNSMKGALVGAPMGVCVNCAVPTACGVTRGKGRLEVALGFLFSSPNFNPVVIMMSVSALPLAMVLTKYAIMALMIVLGVPLLVRFFADKAGDGEPDSLDAEGEACLLPSVDVLPRESTAAVARELAGQFARNVSMLAKPTIAIMLIASFLSAAVLAVLPLDELLANPTLLRLGVVSFIATLMPVPIALDVLFAAQLHASGGAPGFVMLFAMTLGTFSIVPAIFLWREVSRGLAVALILFFATVGWGLAWAFQVGVF